MKYMKITWEDGVVTIYEPHHKWQGYFRVIYPSKGTKFVKHRDIIYKNSIDKMSYIDEEEAFLEMV